ncbi:MAG TPA: hypothetical protein VHS59_12235, partial [Bacillota bacterium]|nr:hypothetical protein [Bacillota bacterium]
MLNLQKNCKGHKEKTLIITDPTRFSEPLLLKEAEPGDVLEVKLLGLSASAVALCYASVSAPERNGHHLPLTSQGGCLLPSPLYPGNQLYLPVYLPGGGLSLGSPLGAFNGEPLQIQAEIRILEDFPLQRPRLENPFALAFLASATSA